MIIEKLYNQYENKYTKIENSKMFYYFINEIEKIYNIEDEDNHQKILDILHTEIEKNTIAIKNIMKNEILNELKNKYHLNLNYDYINNVINEKINLEFPNLDLDNYNFNFKNDIDKKTDMELKEHLKEIIYTILANYTTLEDYELSDKARIILEKNKYNPNYIFKNTNIFLKTFPDKYYNKKYLIDEVLNQFNLQDEYIKSKEDSINFYKEKVKYALKLNKDNIINDPNGYKIIIEKKKKNVYFAFTTDIYIENNNIIKPKIALIIDSYGNTYSEEEFNKKIKKSKQEIFNNNEELIMYLYQSNNTANIFQNLYIEDIKESIKSYLTNIGLYTFSGLITFVILKLISKTVNIETIIGINIGFFIGKEITDHFKGKKFIMPNIVKRKKSQRKINNNLEIAKKIDNTQINSTIINKKINELLNSGNLSLNNLKNLKKYINNDLIYGILNSEDTNKEKTLVLE